LKRFLQVIFVLIPFGLSVLSSCKTYQSFDDIRATYPEARISGEELRIRVDELGVRFPIILRIASNEIQAQTGDPEIRRRAVLWEMTATSMIQRAVFYDNPLVALGELWAISVQMTYYFEKGDGKNVFGAYQNTAVSACKGLEAETEKVARDVLKPEDLQSIKAELDNWASKEGALHGELMLRESTLPLHSADLLGSKKVGAFEALSNINESIDKVSKSVVQINERLPEYIGWHLKMGLSGVFQEAEKIANKLAYTESLMFIAIFGTQTALLIVLIVMVRKLRK